MNRAYIALAFEVLFGKLGLPTSVKPSIYSIDGLNGTLYFEYGNEPFPSYGWACIPCLLIYGSSDYGAADWGYLRRDDASAEAHHELPRHGRAVAAIDYFEAFTRELFNAWATELDPLQAGEFKTRPIFSVGDRYSVGARTCTCPEFDDSSDGPNDHADSCRTCSVHGTAVKS